MNEELESVTQSLYKQNLELAVKNKTLSILGKLYEISIQTLSSHELALQVTSTIQSAFDFERVGILLYDADTDTATVLGYSESERFHTARAVANDFFNVLKVEHASDTQFLQPIISKKEMGYTEAIADVWGHGLKEEEIKKITEEGHVRSLLGYPLIIQGNILGFFVLTLNRVYADLIDYEKESIQSFTNVIAVALDKARLYEELSISNEKLEDANARLEQLDQLKSEFLSVASHQLRAPITAIRGYISNIIENSYGDVPTYLNEPLAVVQESARIMISSIEDYLNVSRIEQGRMHYDFAPLNVTELVKRAVDEFQPIAQKKNLKLTFENSPDITITADVGKIKQVFTNLIDNAIKYTEQGSITASISQTENGIRFMTSDTGVGIPSDEIDKLFEKFTRARDANKVNTTGTGLGLYVAKKLVEGHGGTVHAESDGPGKGSRFIVELPMEAKGEPEPATV